MLHHVRTVRRVHDGCREKTAGVSVCAMADVAQDFYYEERQWGPVGRERGVYGDGRSWGRGFFELGDLQEDRCGILGGIRNHRDHLKF